MASFYVKRIRERDGRVGWVGPIRGAKQAQREAQAWRDATDSFGGGWMASVYESDAYTRKLVREWQRDVRCGFVKTA